MQIDMTGAIEHIRNVGRDTAAAVLDKLSRTRKELKSQRQEKEEFDELMENLRKARNDWMAAVNNYEFASEAELVDYYSYTIKAAQIKYDYLLKKVKEIGNEQESGEMFDVDLSKLHNTVNNFK